MSDPAKAVYEFGPFRLDPVERQLWRGAEEIQLAQKSFKVLTLLVENGGHVVDKNELMEKVWPDAFVEENRLADNISTLRKALGDDPKTPSYIRTVPGRGYRFVADVREVRGSGEDLMLVEQTRSRVIVEEDDRPTNDDGRPAQIVDSAHLPLVPAASLKKWTGAKTLAATCAALAMLLVAAYYFTRVGSPGSEQPSQFKSLAVLPLKQLGATSGEDEYLGQGLADALITKLSNVQQIAIRPTSAVLKYGGSAQRDLQAVAREQLVDAVLDGSFQRAGERLRVTVQLVRASDGATLWAETFDEKFTDIFAVQDAISARAVEALSIRLSSEQRSLLAKGYTKNPEAYQLYLRGRYHWNRRTPDGINKAVEYFNKATVSDPSYALAYTGLADSYSLLAEYTNAPFRESMAQAKAASLKALEIDTTLAEAHISLAYVKHSEWDWDGVEDEYKRGLVLNPNYATGHQWYSEYLVYTGRTDEALKEIKLAQQLDPVSLIINTRIGMTLYYSRRYDEAIEQLSKTLDFDSDFILIHIFLYKSLAARGLHRQLIPHVIKGYFHVNSDDERARIEADLTAAYEAFGEKGLWEKLHDVIKGTQKRDYNYPFSMAETYLRLGDEDKAFLWLHKATDVRHPGVAALKVEPLMDGLRTDPRYVELLRRMSL